MSNTIVEFDLEEMLAQPPPVCTHHSGCSTSASWLLRCRGCGDHGLVCHLHRQVLLVDLNSFADGIYCLDCNRRGEWEYVMEIRPI